MRSVILCIAALGTALFGGAFALSFASPLLIERIAREVMQLEVERRVGAKIDSLSNSRIVGLAQKAMNKTDEDIATSTRQLKAGIPQKVASAIADMLNADCECRKRMVAYAEKSATGQLSSLIQVRARLIELVEASYAHVAASLLQEFRVFTGANALVFLVLAAVAWQRRQASAQLFLPALVLVGAVLLTAGLYLFGQDWLHTVVFNEYVGLAYIAYLAVAVALLWDVAFNRARVSTQLINHVASAVGSSVQVVPC
jgi:hypothetical protein